VGGFSAWGFKFLLYDAEFASEGQYFPQNYRILTFRECSLCTDGFINETDFTLIVKLRVVSLEAALNTHISLTIRPPKHCLLSPVLVTHNTPLCWP
jgi:hypothetical protein